VIESTPDENVTASESEFVDVDHAWLADPDPAMIKWFTLAVPAQVTVLYQPYAPLACSATELPCATPVLSQPRLPCTRKPRSRLLPDATRTMNTGSGVTE